MTEYKLEFDHIGITTDEIQPDESWVEASRCWVTNPNHHKYHIEYLRYEPDTPVAAELIEIPHVAYRVRAEDFDALLEGENVLIPPFAADANLTVAFIKKNGVIVEYMVFKDPDLWFGKQS